MVKIETRKNNSIIVANIDGKNPIRIVNGVSKQAHLFHTPVDLLLISISACVNFKIIKICEEESYDFSLINLTSTFKDDKWIELTIVYPANINNHVLNRIMLETDECWASNLLKEKPKIIFSQTSVEEIRKQQTESKGCCG